MTKNIKFLIVVILVCLVIPLSACIKKADKQYQTVFIDKISGKLDNPGMGWSITENNYYLGQMDGGTTGDYEGIDAINFTATWASMEKEEGN